MEKNKNRRTFEFYKKNGKRETDTGEHKETKRGKRTGGTLRKNTLLCVGRAILWIMLIFFFVRGVIVTFRPDTLTEAQQVISDFMHPPLDKSCTQIHIFSHFFDTSYE